MKYHNLVRYIYPGSPTSHHFRLWVSPFFLVRVKMNHPKGVTHHFFKWWCCAFQGLSIFVYVYAGPPNLHFLDVFMVKNLVFRWPKPLIVLWVLSGTSWISTGSTNSRGSWLKMTWRPRKPALPTWGRRVYGFQDFFFAKEQWKRWK